MKKTTFLAIAAVLTFTVALLIGCDLEDEVKDKAEDEGMNEFEDSAEFELEPLTVGPGDANAKALHTCGDTSVNSELEKADIDPNDITINEIDLLYVQARYSDASWLPEDITTLTCSLYLGPKAGSQGPSVTMSETAVNNGSNGAWEDLTLTDEAVNAVNYYLSHPDEVFEYCVDCTDEPDSGFFRYWVNIGVNVEGEYNL